MPPESKIQSWIDKRFTLTDRLSTPSAAQRDSTSQDVLDEKLGRGDIVQRLRLLYYPSIEVDFDDMYAGTVNMTLSEVEDKLYSMGYRNNPTAYVEITDDYGPDDGSYSRQLITEDAALPSANYLPIFRDIPAWKRIKLQFHITTFVDDDRVHLLSHREVSAWLQPLRHLTISEANTEIGVRDFRDQWIDEFDEPLPTPLE